MGDLRNISLPFAAAKAEPEPRKLKRQSAQIPQAGLRARMSRIAISLPDVSYLHRGSDRDAGSRNELVSIAAEAQGHADLALTIFEADRLCSWLTPEQRVAVREQLRALNLLAVEAHMRALDMLPLCPGPLPIRRLCAHLIMWRDQLPYLCWRLSLQGRDIKVPQQAKMDDNMPSMAIRKDVFSSHAGLFDLPKNAKASRLGSSVEAAPNKTFYRPEGAAQPFER